MSETELRILLLEGLRKVAPETDPASLGGEENIRETLDIDSFDFLNFLIELNDRLGVEIPEADYGRLTTLNAMMRYLGPKV
jgi:acyl carrier protein